MRYFLPVILGKKDNVKILRFLLQVSFHQITTRIGDFLPDEVINYNSSMILGILLEESVYSFVITRASLGLMIFK